MSTSLASTAASQLLRALRGSEAQAPFSTRLGYRSNVAAEWEGGRRFPNALELLRICGECEIDAASALEALSPRHAGAIRPDDLGPWFDALRGSRSQQALADRADRSRHQIRRWLTGSAVPRIPDLLVLLDALTGRSATFVASLVGDSGVPALRSRLRSERRRARQLRQEREATLETSVLEALSRAGVDNLAVHTVPIDPRQLEQVAAVAEDGVRRIERADASSTLAVWVVGSARPDPTSDVEG